MKTTLAVVVDMGDDATDEEELEVTEAADAPGDDTTTVLVATADPFED